MARTKFQPKETEYNGVLFRSKSEAMFSRLFHLHGRKHAYEPTFILQSEWTPDFAFVDLNGPMMLWTLAEYKPSLPTGTYTKWLESCCDEVWSHWVANGIDVRFWLVCFDWYEPQRCDSFFVWDFYDKRFQSRGTASSFFAITPELRKEILKTRFDLMESSNYGG